VYDRRIHFFSLADVNRVIRGYFVGSKSGVDILQQAILDISIGMLMLILQRFGLAVFAHVIYTFMYSIVDWVLNPLRVGVTGSSRREVALERLAALLSKYGATVTIAVGSAKDPIEASAESTPV